MADPYKILGVPKSSSSEEIKKAYRKLAKEYHPDKEGGNEEKFKAAADAYDTLGNSEKRQAYDQRANNPFNGGGFDESFFDEFIRNGGSPFQGGGFNSRGHGV